MQTDVKLLTNPVLLCATCHSLVTQLTIYSLVPPWLPTELSRIVTAGDVYLYEISERRLGDILVIGIRLPNCDTTT
jgi:hypothetical protein